MNFVEGVVHPLIKSQFPQFYNEEGPRFVEFVKEYYKWMEQEGNALQISRSLQALRDVDSTTDDLFVHFKEQFEKGLPLATEADKRLFLKYIVNLYNSKGSERGVQLLLRAMFNESAEVFYPGDKLFKASDGVWYVPKYLELTISTRSLDYIGKEIIGNISGAKAFVEKLTMQRIRGKYFNIAYLSNIRGVFTTGEHITESSNLVLDNAPSVIGSLTTLEVITGGQDFVIGDVFDIVSTQGERGKARVTGVSNQTGIVSFTLIDGGWGYTNTTSEVLISSKVLEVNSIANANTLITGFARFETVTQNLRSVGYTSSPNSSLFVVGSLVENYDGGGAIIANAVIVTATTSNSSAGSLVICPISGAVNTDATFSLRGNTTTGVISSFTNTSATGNVIGSNATSVGLISVLNQFLQTPYANISGADSNTRALVANVSTGSQANFAVGMISNIETDLLSPDFLAGNNAANVPFYTINLNGNNAGYSNSSLGFPNYINGNTAARLLDVLRFNSVSIGTISTLKDINPGTGYNVDPFVVVLEKIVWGYNKHDFQIQIANATGAFTVNEQVTATYNDPTKTLTVISFTGTAANGTVTSAPVPAEFVYQSNGTSNIGTGFVESSALTGGNGSIVLISVNGAFVNTTNSTLVLHTLTTGATANITNVQTTSRVIVAKGFVKSTSNTTVLRLKRVTLPDLWANGQVIIGTSSGTSANVIGVDFETTTDAVGINANVEANVQTSNNAVTNLVISDSGFGYIDNEVCNLTTTNTVFVVSAKTHLGQHGVGTGFYTSANGFLSDVNKLQDGEYYQDFSYEVQTKIPFNKYFDVLKQVVHLAGTKAFGRVVSVSEIPTTMVVSSNVSIA